MNRALELAELGRSKGEVPIGAVIATTDEIIAEAHNETESSQSATAHAEILAIQRAGEQANNWRLQNHIICVTLEPCTMCVGAIKLARIPILVFGAHEPARGACGSIYNLAQDERTGPAPRIIEGVLESQCTRLIQSFFKEAR